MITAIVTFKLPPELTREQWQEQNKQSFYAFSECAGPDPQAILL